MATTNKRAWLTIRSKLSEAELNNAVVYLLSMALAEGTKLDLPNISIDITWEAKLAFIDRQPLANYAHSCRYILFNIETGKSQSIEAQFPPFGRIDKNRWSVLYKAPIVPDTALAVKQEAQFRENEK
jgi:hypothetical protein